ncbi:MAG: hypothetical protein ABF391_07625 [Akkermansiaceae bacterium]|jgi:hypothetical protein
MLPGIPTPGRERSIDYVGKFAASRKQRSKQNSSKTGGAGPQFLPGEKPLQFGLNEPAPSPHRIGLGFITAVFLLASLLFAFLLWMQSW